MGNLFDSRVAVICLFPPLHNLVGSAAGPFRRPNQHEHRLQGLVAAHAVASPIILGNGEQQRTRIGEFVSILVELDGDVRVDRIIAMNQGIDKRFAQGCMGRRFVLPDALFQGERLRQDCGQFGIDPVVKLEEVRFPGAVRTDAVCPTVVGIGAEIFAVVGKILGASVSIRNAVHFAEHQQTG